MSLGLPSLWVYMTNEKCYKKPQALPPPPCCMPFSRDPPQPRSTMWGSLMLPGLAMFWLLTGWLWQEGLSCCYRALLGPWEVATGLPGGMCLCPTLSTERFTLPSAWLCASGQELWVQNGPAWPWVGVGVRWEMGSRRQEGCTRYS